MKIPYFFSFLSLTIIQAAAEKLDDLVRKDGDNENFESKLIHTGGIPAIDSTKYLSTNGNLLIKV